MISEDFKFSSERHKLAAVFFIQFARFEYAMKKSGYLVKNCDYAKPNWKGLFNEEIIKKAFEDLSQGKLKTAVEFYLENPPEQQIVKDNNELGFKTVIENGCTAHKLSTYVTRVRNNLFHGAKCDPQNEDDLKRDKALIQHGLVILNACLKDSELRNFY